MSAAMPQLLKSPRTGMYYVPMTVPGKSRKKWVSTGEMSIAKAQAVVRESGVDKLAMMASAGCMTADAISVATVGRKFTCRDILEAWLELMTTQNSGVTATSYRYWIERLFADLQCDRKPFTALSRRYIDAFVNEGGKINTCRQKLTAVRGLFKFAAANAYCLGDISKTVNVRHRDMTFDRKEPSLSLPMTREEYDLIQGSERVPLFWRRAVILSWWLGLRLGDVCSLEYASLGHDGVIIYARKRMHRLDLPFSDPLIGSWELRALCGELMIGPRADPVYCFPEKREQYLRTQHTISQNFTRWCDRLDIRFKTFHSIRHAFCTRLAEAGRTVEDIGKLVGHAKTGTTEGYIHGKTA